MVGICHATCGFKHPGYGQFRMCPPNYLSDEQLSFLVPYFCKLYSLPGGDEPDRELRFCLAHMLRNYPDSMINPIQSLHEFLIEYKQWAKNCLYTGDLEADFLRALGEIQKVAKQNPAGIELDFRT